MTVPEIQKTEVIDNNDSILVDRFISLISVCNNEHLSYCRCQEDKINTLYNEYLKNEIKELKDQNLIKNDSVVEVRKKHALNKARQDIAKQCQENNIKCPIEQNEIYQTVALFNKKFDINDPRVYMIVKAVLSHQLSVYRMQLQSNDKGILQRVHDEEGNVTYIINPVEEAKRRLDDSIIIAIEKLNKIMNGEKHFNLNANVEVDWNNALSRLDREG